MGRVNPKKRKIQLRIRHKRKIKLAKLRQAYQKAKSESDKKTVLDKLFKIAPWLSREEFLKPVEKRSS